MAEISPEVHRIGVFGSAFNPPHIGHQVLIGEAMDQLRLESVIVVPTGDSYHKEVVLDPGAGVRLRLARAAFGELDGLEVSAAEVGRDGPSYTCDTLEEIADLLPDSEIHLLMGADSALGFASWHRPERILELAQVAVVLREGVPQKAIRDVFTGPKAGGRLNFFEMPEVAISSSLVRERVGNGAEYRHLVKAPVAEIIKNEDLYGRS